MRRWILIAVVLAGIVLFVPKPAEASQLAESCPHINGQNLRPIQPFYNTRTKQLVMLENDNARVVQMLADNVQDMQFYDYTAWSPSCRYFVYALGLRDGNQTVIWDTIDQKQVAIFNRKSTVGLYYLHWGETDNYLILGSFAGQFLWKIPSNEQIQMNNHDSWIDYSWDTPHHQVLTFDGIYVVAYSLDTGQILQRFPTPFFWYVTTYDFTPDGKTLTIYNPADLWSVTWDRSTGKVIGAKDEPSWYPADIQFSPDRQYIVVGEYGGIIIYKVSDGTSPGGDGWTQYAYIPADYYTWRFTDATTLELTYTKTGKQRFYDLLTKSFR